MTPDTTPTLDQTNTLLKDAGFTTEADHLTLWAIHPDHPEGWAARVDEDPETGEISCGIHHAQDGAHSQWPSCTTGLDVAAHSHDRATITDADEARALLAAVALTNLEDA